MGIIASTVQKLLTYLALFFAVVAGLYFKSWCITGFIFFLGLILVYFISLIVAGVD